MIELVKKMKPQEDLEKVKVKTLILNNKKIASFIGNIHASYVRGIIVWIS